MNPRQVVRAWGKVLSGREPALSIELTKECPLTCPGCYAFQPDHLDGVALKSLADFRDDALVNGVLDLVAKHRPLVVYIVGGEPLVRFRELSAILPKVCAQTIETHVVTSAVRRLPPEWAKLGNLTLDKAFQAALHNATDPGHDAALTKWTTLNKQAHPQERSSASLG